ncbi:MAG: 1-acyl-sn-glycerol-3-phosphate acyltransferase [Pseudohongiellaceae bacterium]|nr:1-acyl-sn-glycerol-3-phosphate acyltransferase [Pseudohongiellaceae bacterium]
MDQFKEIRPYHDEEVRPVIDGLLDTPDFINSIAGFALPTLYRYAPRIARFLTEKKLRKQLKHVDSVSSMQSVIAVYMDEMIERTAPRLTHSGLEKLSKDKSYLFVSNHRDIAMDPAFVNYMLYHAGFDTVRIAIGDNLLKRPFVNDLMRLNKSFIVMRSLKGRELLKSSKLLSEYIHHCIETGHNVWIAQREGRAKDGVDKTDTALLKMLSMAKRSEGFSGSLNALNIVPVSISYEVDPCDAMKADELYQKAEKGSFQKDDQSDINSIVTGMIGFKGHVHVAFGDEIKLESDDAEEAAQIIDDQVLANYQLQATNYAALYKLMALCPEQVPELKLPKAESDLRSQESVIAFEKRLAEIPENQRLYFLRMYANPVIRRFASTS